MQYLDVVVRSQPYSSLILLAVRINFQDQFSKLRSFLKILEKSLDTL